MVLVPRLRRPHLRLSKAKTRWEEINRESGRRTIFDPEQGPENK